MNAVAKKQEIISKGAEATLFQGYWFGRKVIFKHRIPKKYRIEKLDRRIRISRTLNEARALIKIKELGVNVPQVYEIDTKNFIIVMKFIEGIKLRDIVDVLSEDKLKMYFTKIGEMIALLHFNGHVHGDITTSNIIVTKNESLFLLDFGLHEYSDTIEDKSVDLHLFKRVLLSSHGKVFQKGFNYFLEGYAKKSEKLGFKEFKQIIKNVSVIETRGRYVKKEERS
ncbi:MAG: KEOPS complex kinase/ATPase Bud32 [Promethearchaeota archaeon]